MRELTAEEVELVSGGDLRGAAVGAGRIVGMGLGYGLCLPCGGLGTVMATAAGAEVGGYVGGYVYDHPTQVLQGALMTVVGVRATSRLMGTTNVGVVSGGEFSL